MATKKELEKKAIVLEKELIRLIEEGQIKKAWVLFCEHPELQKITKEERKIIARLKKIVKLEDKLSELQSRLDRELPRPKRKAILKAIKNTRNEIAVLERKSIKELSKDLHYLYKDVVREFSKEKNLF